MHTALAFTNIRTSGIVNETAKFLSFIIIIQHRIQISKMQLQDKDPSMGTLHKLERTIQTQRAQQVTARPEFS